MSNPELVRHFKSVFAPKNESVIQLSLTPSSRQSLNVLTCLEAQFETTNNDTTLNLRLLSTFRSVFRKIIRTNIASDKPRESIYHSDVALRH